MNIIQKIQSTIDKFSKHEAIDESVLNQSTSWIKAITWGLIGTTGFAVAWLSIAKTEEIVIAPGKLEPIGSVRDIQLPVGGIAKDILVKDGDRVLAGQILMKLDTESSNQTFQSLTDSLHIKETQLSLKRLELKRYIAMNKDVVNSLKVKVAFEKEILIRLQNLAKVGASPELQYLQQRNTVQDTEGRLRANQLDGLRQQSIIEQDIEELKGKISRLKAELTESKVTLRYQELKSPVDGIVFDLQAKNPGYSARTTETVMKIVPIDSLEARIEIPSQKIGFVRIGMPTDISIDSFPASDFGVVEGKVLSIGSDALPPDPSKQKMEYRYPATISLQNQELELNNGSRLGLQPGMSLTANIKLREVSYLQMLMGSFQDKTDSLRQL